MFYLRQDLGLFRSQSNPKSMLFLFLTDVTVSPLLLPLEQNLDPLSLTPVDIVGSYLQAGWTSPLTLFGKCVYLKDESGKISSSEKVNKRLFRFY